MFKECWRNDCQGSSPNGVWSKKERTAKEELARKNSIEEMQKRSVPEGTVNGPRRMEDGHWKAKFAINLEIDFYVIPFASV